MRTSYRWKSKPGNFDTVNALRFFESDNEYGIPTLNREDFVPEWLIPVKKRVQYKEQDLSKGAVHFFVDDYHFEVVWNRPTQLLKTVTDCGSALSPDFSLYVGDPPAVQIWNTYRNRWVGRYWQSRGIRVIPSITWSDEQSYKYCFLGVPKGSTVAVSTVGVNRGKEVRERFCSGFEEMLKAIEPELVLVYGEVAPMDIDSMVKTKWFPSYWKTMRDIVTKKKQRLTDLD